MTWWVFYLAHQIWTYFNDSEYLSKKNYIVGQKRHVKDFLGNTNLLGKFLLLIGKTSRPCKISRCTYSDSRTYFYLVLTGLYLGISFSYHPESIFGVNDILIDTIIQSTSKTIKIMTSRPSVISKGLGPKNRSILLSVFPLYRLLCIKIIEKLAETKSGEKSIFIQWRNCPAPFCCSNLQHET